MKKVFHAFLVLMLLAFARADAAEPVVYMTKRR